MDKSTLFAKTGKGLMEVKNRSRALSKDLHRLLTLIDGRSTYVELQEKLAPISERDLVVQLRQLSDLGFIKEIIASPRAEAAPSPGLDYADDLDFTSFTNASRQGRANVYSNAELGADAYA